MSKLSFCWNIWIQLSVESVGTNFFFTIIAVSWVSKKLKMSQLRFFTNCYCQSSVENSNTEIFYNFFLLLRSRNWVFVGIVANTGVSKKSKLNFCWKICNQLSVKFFYKFLLSAECRKCRNWLFLLQIYAVSRESKMSKLRFSFNFCCLTNIKIIETVFCCNICNRLSVEKVETDIYNFFLLL